MTKGMTKTAMAAGRVEWFRVVDSASSDPRDVVMADEVAGHWTRVRPGLTRAQLRMVQAAGGRPVCVRGTGRGSF